MSKRDELLTSCRYYKGENENPYKDGNKALFWDFEKNWIDMFLDGRLSLIEYWEEYV